MKTVLVTEVAYASGRSVRQIQRLAAKGIVPSVLSADGYHRTYPNTPKLRQWVLRNAKTQRGNQPNISTVGSDFGRLVNLLIKTRSAFNRMVRGMPIHKMPHYPRLHLAEAIAPFVRMHADLMHSRPVTTA